MSLGSDFGGTLDLGRTLSEVAGIRALTESILRRLSTETGSLPDFPEYGEDLTQYIGASSPSAEVIQARIEDQCYQEEEVLNVTVDVNILDTLIEIKIVGEAAEGPFDLSIKVDELGVSPIIPGAL
jgi:hypothetical protein